MKTTATIILGLATAMSLVTAGCRRTPAGAASQPATAAQALAARLDSAATVVSGCRDVACYDLSGLETGDSLNCDGVPFAGIRAAVAAQAVRGGVSTLLWRSGAVADSAAVASALADFFLSLADSTGQRVPVVFSPRAATGLWHRLRRAFDVAGVDNVLWAYSPGRVDSYNEYMECYPGDGYVDIMGLDIYHTGVDADSVRYQRDLERSLGIAMQAADAHGKLLALTGTDTGGEPVADWYARVLQPVIRAFPISYAVVRGGAPIDSVSIP